MKRQKTVKVKAKEQSVKRHHATAKRTKTKLIQRKSDQRAIAQPDSPYRPGTLYGSLFVEGNRDYILKSELIKRVAELTGKSEKVVNFAYQVLKSPKHRSNKNRSTELTEGDKVKLILIRKNQ